MLIFIKKVEEAEWEIVDKKSLLNFFKENYSSFENMGGDVETLFFNCKI